MGLHNTQIWIINHASTKVVIILFIGYLIFPLALLPKIIPSGTTPPFDLLFYYDANTVYQMLADYGAEVRQRYFWGCLLIDSAYPLYYGALISMTIATILKHKGHDGTLGKLVFLPALAVMADFSENALIVSLLYHYPQPLHWAANTLGYVTCSKWLMFAVIGLVILWLLTLHKPASSPS